MSTTAYVHPNWPDPLFWQYVARLQEQYERAIAKSEAKRKALRKNGSA
jgi:hypothetical protein